MSLLKSRQNTTQARLLQVILIIINFARSILSMMPLRNNFIRVVAYLTLGLLWNEGISADHSSSPRANIDDSTTISYKYHEVPIMKQVKTTLVTYTKELMIGGASLIAVGITLILFLRKKEEALPPSQVEENTLSQRDLPLQPRLRYNQDGPPLMKLPLEALKFKTDLPKKVKEIIHSFPWTKEGIAQARTNFASNKSTQEYLDLLEGISYQPIPLQESDPSWITLKKGINLQFKCSNNDCPSNQARNEQHGHPNYVLINYDSDFLLGPKINCPVDNCRRKINQTDLQNIFMYQCHYKLKASKIARNISDITLHIMFNDPDIEYCQEGDTKQQESITKFWLGGNNVAFRSVKANVKPF